MSESVKELRGMSIQDLVEKHDALAKHTEVGTRHYIEEIYRRDSQKGTRTVVTLTKWIAVMTLIIMAATIVNVVIFILR